MVAGHGDVEEERMGVEEWIGGNEVERRDTAVKRKYCRRREG